MTSYDDRSFTHDGGATAAGEHRTDEVSGTLPAPPWRRFWPLAVEAAVVMLLAWTGVLPQWSGLVHLVALPPVDVFTDLRLLLLLAPSWPVFLAVLAAVLAVRACVLAWLLGGLTPDRLRFAALFHALTAPWLLVAALLDGMAHAVLYARLFWPGVTVLALVAFAMGPVPWQGSRRMRTAVRRAWRRGLRLEVLIPYATALLLLGVAAEVAPRLAVWLVPVSALLTALGVRGLCRPPAEHPVRLLLAAATVAVVLTVATVAFPREELPSPGPSRAGSLLLMSGINSSSGSGAIVETDVARLGYSCDQVFYFSYAGPGDGQPRGAATCPIRTGAPYVRDDTHRPLAEQVRAFAAQAADLPRPLVVTGHSHGAWVAWEAVASGAAPAVDVLLLVGPFPDSPIGYPAPDEAGPGRVFGDLMRLVVPLSDVFDFNFRPDSPAARELLATPNAARELFGQPLPPEVRTLSMTAVSDLPLMPGGWRLDVERNGCPQQVPHPLLPVRAPFYDETIRFLAGQPPRPCPPWQDWGAVAARPFGVPPRG